LNNALIWGCDERDFATTYNHDKVHIKRRGRGKITCLIRGGPVQCRLHFNIIVLGQSCKKSTAYEKKAYKLQIVTDVSKIGTPPHMGP